MIVVWYVYHQASVGGFNSRLAYLKPAKITRPPSLADVISTEKRSVRIASRNSIYNDIWKFVQPGCDELSKGSTHFVMFWHWTLLNFIITLEKIKMEM